MNNAKIKNEADALQDILKWSSDRPTWQREALRRLVTNGELTENDIVELTALCKDSTSANQPLTAAHISAPSTSAPSVALRNIRNVQNVNALADGQSLNFIPKESQLFMATMALANLVTFAS